MKKNLLKILACPACRFHPLILTATRVVRNEVVAGMLRCPECNQEYPIENEIPELLIGLKGWYEGAGSPEAYDEHFDKWGPKTQAQAKHPWPYKIVIAKRTRGLVLDVGCGPGFLQRYLENTIFLDFSLVCLLKRWIGKSRPRVRANAESLPFRDWTFDTVVATELIEHTDNPHKLVEEVHRVLKEGGQFLFSFPWRDRSSTHHFKVITKDMVHEWISPFFAEYEYDVPPVRKERGMVYARK